MPEAIIKAPQANTQTNPDKIIRDYEKEVLEHLQKVLGLHREYKSEQEQLIKQYQKALREYNTKNKNLEQQLCQKNTECEQFICEKVHTENRYNELQNKYQILEGQNKSLQQKYDIIQDENKELKLKLGDVNNRILADNSSLPLVIEFNNWAMNPVSKISGNFKYISGEMKIRQNQVIEESVFETKWILNRDGSKYFLFPNPCLFNEMTDISELYKILSGKLRTKGQNKIKIIKPCEISDQGFIEHPGELQIL
jgi:hypothetical protein